MAKVASKALDFEKRAVEFSFVGLEPEEVKLSDFSEEVQLHFALHGMSQKLGDSYSSCKGDVAAAHKMFTDTKAQLLAGDWRSSAGEGESKPRTTELAEALARIKGVPLEEVQNALSAATDEEKKTLRSNERVKTVIAVIRAEKQQAKFAKLEADGKLPDLPGFGAPAKQKAK